MSSVYSENNNSSSESDVVKIIEEYDISEFEVISAKEYQE